jgi:hypothetical protein
MKRKDRAVSTSCPASTASGQARHLANRRPAVLDVARVALGQGCRMGRCSEVEKAGDTQNDRPSAICYHAVLSLRQFDTTLSVTLGRGTAHRFGSGPQPMALGAGESYMVAGRERRSAYAASGASICRGGGRRNVGVITSPIHPLERLRRGPDRRRPWSNAVGDVAWCCLWRR